MRKIMVIDDDALMRRSLNYNLERAGFEVSTASNAEDGILMARQNKPDLVLLDIGLPGMDGLDALKQFRNKVGCPVIFVTARRRELDQVVGLESGADDYVTKPFDTDVLIARIKAVLRRSDVKPLPEKESKSLNVGDLTIDTERHSVFINGRDIDLSPKEFSLLNILASNKGKMVSNTELISNIWGEEYQGESQVLYVHIRWLREKIEDDPNNPTRIITVRGLGYRLEG
jgi:DNA-binding response OmpR family regulator